ncbi:hypothetical protein MRB56_08025 [Halomonas cupida]|uniref:DUF1275 family protein n=1 Tax=Halomonas cupida TaxID=44933 RepID=UPI0039B590CF
MKTRLLAILGLNAGYGGTAGVLTVLGLFTAHVTGNFVMIGDELALVDMAVHKSDLREL